MRIKVTVYYNGVWLTNTRWTLDLYFTSLSTFYIFLNIYLCLWPCVLAWNTALLGYELLYLRDLEQVRILCWKGVLIVATLLTRKAKMLVKATFPNPACRRTEQKLSFELSQYTVGLAKEVGSFLALFCGTQNHRHQPKHGDWTTKKKKLWWTILNHWKDRCCQY